MTTEYEKILRENYDDLLDRFHKLEEEHTALKRKMDNIKKEI